MSEELVDKILIEIGLERIDCSDDQSEQVEKPINQVQSAKLS